MENEIGTIKYAVSDHGSDIRKGLRLANIKNVYDMTHKIASLLRKMYEKDEVFNELTSKISKMRLKLAQSHLAYLVPKNQRKKARYQNIKSISDWAIKFLDFLDSSPDLSKEDLNKINWITKYSDFIYELGKINSIINKVEKMIKHKGLSNTSVRYSLRLLSRLSGDKGVFFKEEMEKYFNELLSLFPTTKKLLCVSDIIESAFGKYKNYVSNNPMAGITNLVLCISAFTSKLDTKDIQKALEDTTINHIKQWSQNFIGETLLQKRRAALRCS